MEKSKLTVMNELYEKFKAGFPDEALSIDSSRGFELTSVKAQYIIERLNDVLGFQNWQLNGNFEEDESGGVLFKGYLDLFLGDFTGNREDLHRVSTVGHSDKKKNRGDTYKSAKTDALSKAASYLGVANDVFKGKIKPPKKQEEKKSYDNEKKPETFKGKTATITKNNAF